MPDSTTSTPAADAAAVAYTYNEQGRRTKFQHLDFSGDGGVLIGIEDTGTAISAVDAKRIETRYDERDVAIEVLVYNKDEALVSRVEIVRDEQGNALEENQFLGEVVSFKPCSTGACSTEEQEVTLTEEQQTQLEAEMAQAFAPGAALGKHLHSYDEHERKVESRLTMMGMLVSRQTSAFDGAGNKVEWAHYNEDSSLQSKAIFTRVYDEHGNWTEEIVSSASTWDAEFGLSTPENVTRRVIIYY